MTEQFIWHPQLMLKKILKINIKLNIINYPEDINIIEKGFFIGSNELIKKYISWIPKINIKSEIKKVLTGVNKYESNN